MEGRVPFVTKMVCDNCCDTLTLTQNTNHKPKQRIVKDLFGSRLGIRNPNLILFSFTLSLSTSSKVG